MVNVNIVKRQSMKTAGKKVWISIQENEQFDKFWSESHKNGLIAQLKKIASKNPNKLTNSDVIGISCVEKDPDNRDFYFFIATEINDENGIEGLEIYNIPECTWAVFSVRGEMPMSLFEAEKYAFTEWLPASEYKHANAPELEVYPVTDSSSVEFWLPVVEK